MSEMNTAAASESRHFNNATIEDGEHYARPKWHDIRINQSSGNLNLHVLWNVCAEDGSDLPVPDGYDSWEAPSTVYTIAYAEEAANLRKCAGKDLDYIKDICPKTWKSLTRILSFCPTWECPDPSWFSSHIEEWAANIVRITVIHEEWQGVQQAKVKWTNAKNRPAAAAKTEDTTSQDEIVNAFGKFFKTKSSAPTNAPVANSPAPKNTGLPPSPVPPASVKQTVAAPVRRSDQMACWTAFCTSNHAKGLQGEELNNKWFEILKRTGKSDDRDFTPEDWGKVAEFIEMPF